MSKKKQFTDVEIEFCGKKCHFNRVTNKDLTYFSEKAQTEYDKVIKDWSEKANKLSFKGETLEREINRKEKKMSLLEEKPDADINELLKLNDELEALEQEMSKLTKQLIAHNDKNPNLEWNNIVEEILAEKAETLLDNVTAKDYLENGTLKDTCIASNLEKYYQLAMISESEVKIRVEIEDDVKRFLQERENLRNQQ